MNKKCCRKTDMCAITEEVKAPSDFTPVVEANSISVQIKVDKEVYEKFCRLSEMHGGTPEEHISLMVEEES